MLIDKLTLFGKKIKNLCQQKNQKHFSKPPTLFGVFLPLKRTFSPSQSLEEPHEQRN